MSPQPTNDQDTGFHLPASMRSDLTCVSLAIACVIALLVPTLQGQSTAPLDQPANRVESRLDILEMLYQQRSLENRDPLLRKYIEDLASLRQSYLREDQTRSAEAVEKEIERATKALESGTSLPVPTDDEPRANPFNLAKVATQRRDLSDDDTSYVLSVGADEAVETTWSELRDEPEMIGPEGRSLNFRRWEIGQLERGRYEAVIAFDPGSDYDRCRIKLDVGENITLNLRPDEVLNRRPDSPVYFRIGTVNVDDDLVEVPVFLSIRQRESDNEVRLRGVLLLAH